MISILIFFCVSVHDNSAVAGELFGSQAHHTFNAGQLYEDEHQISMFGNYKYGLTENVEIGIQGAIALIGQTLVPNFYLNHRMFDTESFKTSFTTHIYYSELTFGGFAAIKNSWRLFPRGVMTLGVFDYFVLNVEDNWLADEINALNFYFPSASLDLLISDRWSLNFVLNFAFYGSIEAVDDSVELRADYFVLRDIEDPSLTTFATATVRFTPVFHMEFGAFHASFLGAEITAPYINLFWRLR